MGATGTFSRQPWTRRAIMREFRRSFVDECHIVDYAFSSKKNYEGDTVVYLALDTPQDGVVCYVMTYFMRRAGGYYELVYRATPEYLGPSEKECPAKILALLSPTDNAVSQEWRLSCYNNLITKARSACKQTDGVA